MAPDHGSGSGMAASPIDVETIGSFPGTGNALRVRENPARIRRARWLWRAMIGLIALLIGTLGYASPASADATPGGKLFAGGNFTQAGPAAATRVAAWDGVNWSALVGPNGEGADGTVFAMTMYNGKLVVGGSFLEAGGAVVSGIATWNGAVWEPLVGSTGAIGVSILPLGFVSALAVYNGDLYVGGMFQRAGGIVVNNIARWNGSDWSAVTGPSGFGTNNGGSDIAPVFDMTTVGGRLVAAGEFTTAGGVAANSVAAWNGSTWSSLGQPVETLTILAVENFNGRLVASRSYAEDNVTVKDIAWRDNGVWSVLGGAGGGRVDFDVRDMAIFKGLLIAGGQFSQIGGLTVNGVAAWNGSAWSALSGPSGVGTDGAVFAVTAHWGFLTVGGLFNQAGGVAASNIARWNGAAWSALPGGGTDGQIFELLST
jgi:hypothetical protein